jgi:hypothetical protein
MAEYSSDDEEGDRCTLLTAGERAWGVECTGILEHEREERGPDNERGAEPQQPVPLHEWRWWSGLRSGTGGGSEEKKLKKK